MVKTADSILEGLTPEQKKIAMSMNGKYMVLASSGSGKTRTLTARIEYLIHMGVKPYEIVGISFTKKASDEIKDRMAARIG